MELFNDPLYGEVVLEKWQIKILNLPEFSKYRNIRMTGLLFLNFPSANHTRFENIMGTLHLCDLLQKAYVIQNKNKKCYENSDYEFLNIQSSDWFVLKFASILYHLQNFCYSQTLMDAIEYLDRENKIKFYSGNEKVEKFLFVKIEELFKNYDFKQILKKELELNQICYCEFKKKVQNIFRISLQESRNNIEKMSLFIKDIFPLNRLDYYARDAYYTTGFRTYDIIKILKGFKGICRSKTSNNSNSLHLVFDEDVKYELNNFFFQRIYNYYNFYSNPISLKNSCIFKNLFKYTIQNDEFSESVDSLIERINDKIGIDDNYLKNFFSKLKGNKNQDILGKLYRFSDYNLLLSEPFRLSSIFKNSEIYNVLKDKKQELVNIFINIKEKVSEIEERLINEVKKENNVKDYDIILDIDLPRRLNPPYERILILKSFDSDQLNLKFFKFENSDPISNQFFNNSELNFALINLYYHKNNSLDKKSLLDHLIAIIISYFNDEIIQSKNGLAIREEIKKIFKENSQLRKKSHSCYYDPVHGMISLYPWEEEILNLKYFQRLKWCRQASLTNIKYPGAVHTRFEHTLGTLYIGNKLYQILSRENKQLSNEKHILFKLRLACIFHDIGHGPFSHLTEKLMRRNNDDITWYDGMEEEYSHEYQGADFINTNKDFQNDILKIFVKEEYKNDIIKNFSISSIDKDFVIKLCKDIGEIINGKEKFNNLELKLIKDILCGGLDVDRLDYIVRDSHYTGIGWGTARLNNTLEYYRVNISNNKKNCEIYIESINGLLAAESILFLRNLEIAYIHYDKINRLCEKVIIDTIEKECPPEIKEYLTNKDNILKLADYSFLEKLYNYNERRFYGKLNDLYTKNIFDYYTFSVKLTDLRNEWRIKIERAKSEKTIREIEKEIYNSLNVLHNDNNIVQNIFYNKKDLKTFLEKFDPTKILISIPKIPSQIELNTLVSINEKFYRIEDSSLLVPNYNKSYKTFWTLNIYYYEEVENEFEIFLNDIFNYILTYKK